MGTPAGGNVGATTGVFGVAYASYTVSALWHMTDPTTLVDSSGNGNNGTTTDITSVPDGFKGKGYHFNGSSSLALVDSSDSLNPGNKNIRITVHARLTEPPNSTVGDYDIIRKGRANTTGGDYKMEIVARNNRTTARGFCSFKDSSGTVGKVIGGPDLADGQWHTLSCIKTKSRVKLTVDGTTYTNDAHLGSISNIQPLSIGAQAAGGDWYLGDMDEVSVAIRQ